MEPHRNPAVNYKRQSTRWIMSENCDDENDDHDDDDDDDNDDDDDDDGWLMS